MEAQRTESFHQLPIVLTQLAREAVASELTHPAFYSVAFSKDHVKQMLARRRKAHDPCGKYHRSQCPYPQPAHRPTEQP